MPSMEVVCGIVYGHCIPLLEAIARYVDLAVVVRCEGGRLLLVLAAKDVSKKVVFEVRDEVLLWLLSYV